MQILNIKLPAGEQISSLNYNIDSGEAVIGQESSCQIMLPDQRQKVARRHARFYKEGEQWFLESLGDNELMVNQTTVATQRVLLSDGDLITLGEYQMVISHFEPWQNTQKLSIKPPPLPSAEGLAPEYCVIPDKDGIQASGKINHRKSVCHAMLDALEQTLEDLSPENLEARSPDHTSGRIRRYLGRNKQQNIAPDFPQQYQSFHQQLMSDQSYRLLFLQRFRQAMKKQESH